MTDEDIVAALAEAMNEAGILGCEELDPSDLDPICPDCGALIRGATALLPTVRRVAEQRAAEELLNAAREDGISTHKLTPVEVLTLRVVKLEALFARAAALTATPNHGTDAT